MIAHDDDVLEWLDKNLSKYIHPSTHVDENYQEVPCCTIDLPAIKRDILDVFEYGGRSPYQDPMDE